MSYMRTVGLRELNQRTAQVVAEVAAGEVIEITDRGRPVAVMSPARPLAGVAALRAAGRLRPASASLSDVVPLPRRPGVPTPSEVLAAEREQYEPGGTR